MNAPAEVGLKIALALVALVLRPMLRWVVRRVFPLRDTPQDVAMEVFLRNRMRKSVVRLDAAITALSWVGLAGFPIAAFLAARAWILRNGSPADTVLYFHPVPLFLGFGLAGVLAAVSAGPAIIRLIWRGVEREAMLRLYLSGNRREAGLGRFLVRNAGSGALCLLVGSSMLWGNDYTVIRSRSVDVPGDASWFARRIVPTSELRHLGSAPRPSGGVFVCAVFADGTRLDNLPDGRHLLDGLGKQPARAIAALHDATGVPVQAVASGVSPCGRPPAAE